MYTVENWRTAYDEVEGNGFDPIDSEESAGAMGAALAEAYDKLKTDEYAVLAALEAANQQFPDGWDVDQFNKVVDGFTVRYDDMNEPVQNYLDDNYPGVQIEWLKDDAPVWDGPVRDSEVWIDDTEIPGIYVFNKVR